MENNVGYFYFKIMETMIKLALFIVKIAENRNWKKKINK